jgi:hypothetical protein
LTGRLRCWAFEVPSGCAPLLGMLILTLVLLVVGVAVL